MSDDPNRHHRQSIRLRGYDYTQAGAYFVTIVAHERACLFGEIVDDVMHVNDAGRMVDAAWTALPQRFPAIELDACIIMPNHLHGIIVVVGATLVVAHDAMVAPVAVGVPDRAGTSPAPTLGDIVGAFKSITTHAYIQGVHHQGWPPFNQRVWQRNYYDHIIRNERDLNRIREYISHNPLKRTLDSEYPGVQ